MKKNLVSLMTLVSLVCLASLSSCKKENTLGDGTQFRATMEDCTFSKTALDGTALNWVAGDQIVVYGITGSGIYTATPQTPATTAVFDNVSGETGNAPFRAFYPSTLTTDGVNITLPTIQVSEDGSLTEFPMYAESNNDELTFKNLCGVLKLHLTKANTNISSIAITTNNEANGTYSIDYNGGSPELTLVDNGTNTTMLVCSTAQAIDNGKDFYIYLPPTVDSVKSIVLTTDDARVCTKPVKITSQINVTRSQYTLVTLGESDMDFVEPLPEGALPGLFSVSATQQVRFSQGILQYQASTDTWRFAENQYYVYTAGWQDEFAWGTGLNPTLSTGNSQDYLTFVDWGVNAISNGGNQANLWRTLSANEWQYLIYGRPNASSKYGMGYVNGHTGLILLPDDWTLPTGCTFMNYHDMFYWGDGEYWYEGECLMCDIEAGNVLNYTSQWATLEAAGAVFIERGGRGFYWTSTFGDGNYDYGYYSAYAYGLRLPEESLEIFYGLDELNAARELWYESSVRLVRNN